MLTITRILAPTDLSELSKDGVRVGLDLARSHGARITIYNVLELEAVPRYGCAPHPDQSLLVQLMDERKKLLAHFVHENFADMITGLRILEDVDAGVPYRKILDRAADENSDMIVISTHGRSGPLDALIGSVAELVIRLASCPVLSVHPSMRQQKIETKAA